MLTKLTSLVIALTLVGCHERRAQNELSADDKLKTDHTIIQEMTRELLEQTGIEFVFTADDTINHREGLNLEEAKRFYNTMISYKDDLKDVFEVTPRIEVFKTKYGQWTYFTTGGAMIDTSSNIWTRKEPFLETMKQTETVWAAARAVEALVEPIHIHLVDIKDRPRRDGSGNGAYLITEGVTSYSAHSALVRQLSTAKKVLEAMGERIQNDRDIGRLEILTLTEDKEPVDLLIHLGELRIDMRKPADEIITVLDTHLDPLPSKE